MRIAILSQPANFHCRKWAQALARAGAQVFVYSLDRPTEIPNVRVVQIPTTVRWGGRYRFPAYWTTARTLHRQLMTERIDLLHPLHLTPFGLWGLWSGFRPLIPAAIGADVFDYLPVRLLPSGHLHWSAKQRGRWNADRLKYALSKALYRKWILRLVSNCDALTCDNQPLRQALISGFAARNVHLIRWGIRTRSDSVSEEKWPALAAELGWSPAVRLILAPRGANAFYGADVIMKAFSKLILDETSCSRLDSYRFVLLSAGYPVSKFLRAQAQLLAKTGRFRLVERVLDAAAMQALWSRTDLFVSAPAYDGFSAAETEGRWAGALPVLNDIPAHREWALHGSNAWIVDPFTPENLAATLFSLLQQVDDLKPRVRQANREWIACHADLDDQAQRFIGLAAQVCG